MEVVTALACGAFFALATLAALRGRREPLAARFAVLCGVLFAYGAFDVVWAFSTDRIWAWFDSAAASLVVPAFFHFAVTFVGGRRAYARFVIAAYVYFGALAAACLSPIVAKSSPDLPGGRAWAACMLIGMAPTIVAGAVMLIRHGRLANAEERARAGLVLTAGLIAGAGTALDLVAIAGAASGRISAWALVASAALLGVAAFRSRMLENVSVLVGVNVTAVALGIVFGELALLRYVGGRTTLAVTGSLVIGLSALLAGRFLFGAIALERERMRAHALLGRMSQQLAHDLRNPLAAIRGAAQFLQGEHVAGRSLEPHGVYLGLLLEQSERMARVIDDYQRIGRVAPQLRLVDINGVVDGASASLSGLDKRLAPDLPHCPADPELLAIALENVLRNAREAIGEREGRIEITTRQSGEAVTIAIADDGPGMDPRTRERVFEDFFTTKATGSGLGLSFVRRVIEAHRGRVAIESAEGRGTRVTLELPIARHARAATQL